jgi:hydrogenase maturation factor
MQSSPYGTDAAIIGHVRESSSRGRVIMSNAMGGLREITIPANELLPRIC